VRSTLQKIYETEATGWEKWWQIELAMFLSDYEDVAEWDIEEVFLTDLRTGTAKDRMAIDVCFRRKGYAKGHFVFLELKQDRDWKRCIANMLGDAEKFAMSHKRSESGLDVRSFFLVGVYPSEDKVEVHDYIEDAAERREVDWDFMKTDSSQEQSTRSRWCERGALRSNLELLLTRFGQSSMIALTTILHQHQCERPAWPRSRIELDRQQRGASRPATVTGRLSFKRGDHDRSRRPPNVPATAPCYGRYAATFAVCKATAADPSEDRR
jgi:hypothetical protein